MYRSWAYILMAAATLAGVVALLWPTPPLRTIEEIAMPARAPVRAEAPARAAKPAIKAGQAAKPAAGTAATPAAPAVLQRIPPQNTTTKRAGPLLQNGLEPNMFGKPAAEGVQIGGSFGAAAQQAKPGGGVPARPPLPPRPGPYADREARDAVPR